MIIKKLGVILVSLLAVMFSGFGMSPTAEATANITYKPDTVSVYDGALLLHGTLYNDGDTNGVANSITLDNLTVISVVGGAEQKLYSCSKTIAIADTKVPPGGSVQINLQLWDKNLKEVDGANVKWTGSQTVGWYSLDTVDPVTPPPAAPSSAPAEQDADKSAGAPANDQTGYQCAFKLDKGWYNSNDDAGEIYIDFGNIKDISVTYKGGPYTRLLVPVMYRNLTTGKKTYQKYYFINRPEADKTLWGSFWIEEDMKWYNADWDNISVDDCIEAEGVEIYCLQWVAVDEQTEAEFKKINWKKIDYIQHDYYAILKKVLMYEKGYEVSLDTRIGD